MKKTIIDGVECLVMGRKEIEDKLVSFANNEIKARNFIKEYQEKIEDKKEGYILTDPELVAKSEKEIKLLEVSLASYQFQEIKAKGFKEAFEALLFPFTGSMINIDYDGKLMGHNKE